MNFGKGFTVAVVVLIVGKIATAENLASQALYATEPNSTLQETFDATFTSYQCEGCGCGVEECGCGAPTCCGAECGSNPYGTGNILADSLHRNDCCRQYFMGVDYLYVQANFSEMVAFVEQDDRNALDRKDTFHPQGFQFASSYRLQGGFRDCSSGFEWRFNFTQLNSYAPGITRDAVSTTPDLHYIFPLIPNLSPGYEITSSARARINSYDIGCAKPIMLGSLGCDDPGCGGPSSYGCPTWDFAWEAGVRFADVAWRQDIYSQPAIPTPGADQTHGVNRMRFGGAGLRFGLGGRRYFGPHGCFSVFVNGDISLLVGTVEVTSTRDALESSTNFKSKQQLEVRNVIPVTEIEAGLTAQITDRMAFTAGYTFGAWHDLGVRQEFYPADQQAELGVYSFDDANILAFQGCFGRLEACF